MKTVLAHIFACKRHYAQLPLFQHMRDQSLDARERLAFYPAMAHFILSFDDINKYMLRYDDARSPLATMINGHTFEDDHHWPWYLEDLEKLGFDTTASGSEWMRFLWSDELRQNRILTYRLAPLIADADEVERLVIIEAIEETGNVLFTEIKQLAEILAPRLGTELRYCGDFHFARESGHTVGADHRTLAAIELDDEQRSRCLALADRVFALFAAWTDELLRYALAHPRQRGLPWADATAA
ncbi:MAG: hypothetical protein KC431_19975 [Myxococcales bacterium]|nr:hypothetical protein [Myxococcales bacterium]